jgi:hypothetical protein
LYPAADGKPAETAALIRGLAMQCAKFRAEKDKHPQLIVPGEDHGNAFADSCCLPVAAVLEVQAVPRSV